MEIHLAPELEKLVTESIATGDYRDATDVVSEALSLFQAREEQNRSKLRSKIEEALAEIERGEFVDLNGEDEIHAFFEQVKQRGLEQLQKQLIK